MSLAKGLVKKHYCAAADITLTRRNVQGLQGESEEGFRVSNDNVEASRGAAIVVLAVLPQQLRKVMEEITPAIDRQRQLFVSVVSGVSCAEIRAVLGEDAQVVRAMPNTAIAIGQSMTCIAADDVLPELMDEVTRMFETVGAVDRKSVG